MQWRSDIWVLLLACAQGGLEFSTSPCRVCRAAWWEESSHIAPFLVLHLVDIWDGNVSQKNKTSSGQERHKSYPKLTDATGVMYAEMKMLCTRANEYKDCHLPALQTTLPNPKPVGFVEPSRRAAAVFSVMQLLTCRIQSVTDAVVPFFLGPSRTRRLGEL